MSLPPPSPLPPPTPPDPRKPHESTKRDPTKVALIVGGAVVLSLVVAFAAGDFGGDEPEPGTHNDDFRYDWSGAVCDEHGYSGRFTNNDSEDFNGEVWAVATQGRATIARDREAILDLAPGESATVEFVWEEDGNVQCAIESVDWRY